MGINSLASPDFGMDALQSVHQFVVFGKLVDQRHSLFAERFERPELNAP
jgi:hypothetical protein